MHSQTQVWMDFRGKCNDFFTIKSWFNFKKVIIFDHRKFSIVFDEFNDC